MPRVEIVDSDGVRQNAEIESRGGTVQADSVGTFSPSVIEQIKFDNKGQMSSLTSVCGETENRREGDNKATVTVEGIIRESEIEAMRALKFEDQITFVSDIYRGDVIVQRLSITQSPDVLRFAPTSGEEELAFTFQLQLKEP